MAELFGFEIKRATKNKENDLGSFVAPQRDDGAAIVSEGGVFGQYLDLESTARSEAELVTRYRTMAMQPECDLAIEDIVNESITYEPKEDTVKINLDKVDGSESYKKKIVQEFEEVKRLLHFETKSYDIFRHWYIDGRLFYHIIVDKNDPGTGIQELRFIDPRKIRKIREMKKRKIPAAQGQGLNTNVKLQEIKNEYYLYNEKGYKGGKGLSPTDSGTTQGLKIAKDSILHCTSGLMSEDNKLVVGHLHKAIKPLNQLRILEDATVIYRISRAPERRIFYIDVGNLPKMKAEQYLRDMMTKHKNRLVYDASTGEVRDDRKFMTMLEDYWLPRREGGRGTEITTLPAGQNLGEMEDVLYFQKKLYRALNIPVSRLEPEQGFSLGRASEISRDEIKYQKFITRLRLRFSELFKEALEKQLVLRGVVTPEEYTEIKHLISFDYIIDNHFSELKDMEILTERLRVAGDIDQYLGKYYSQTWVKKNILQQSDKEIEELANEMNQENDQQEPEMGEDEFPE